jgi:hypothetical protein
MTSADLKMVEFRPELEPVPLEQFGDNMAERGKDLIHVVETRRDEECSVAPCHQTDSQRKRKDSKQSFPPETSELILVNRFGKLISRFLMIFLAGTINVNPAFCERTRPGTFQERNSMLRTWK